MKQDILPVQLPNVNESIYAGFGLRLGAKLLDFIFLIPITAIVIYGQYKGLRAFYMAQLFSLLFSLFYNVYLVKRFGGTPGKLVMGIRIITKDGRAADYKEAGLRFLIQFGLSVVSLFLLVSAFSSVDDSYYQSLTFMEKWALPQKLGNQMQTMWGYLNILWALIIFVVMLIDTRKRTVHDFIGGTSVIKDQYKDRIAAYLSEESDEEKM